jgi:hypothetical protein
MVRYKGVRRAKKDSAKQGSTYHVVRKLGSNMRAPSAARAGTARLAAAAAAAARAKINTHSPEH